MLERHIAQVEVDAFEQQVGGDKGQFVATVIQHGAVIAHTMQRRFILDGKILGELVYQAKLTKCGNFGFFHVIYNSSN